MRKNLLALFLVISALIVSANAETRSPFKIGVVAPLTLGNADAGLDMQRTLQLFVSSQLGSNDSVKYIFEDGKCGVGSSATNAAKKLISVDKVDALITGCSGETLQTAPIAQRSGVPLVAVYSSHKDVKHQGTFVFRTFLDMEKGIGLLGERLVNSHQRVAVITENNAFTDGLFEVLKPQLGQALTFNERFPPDSTDLRAILTKSKASKPDAYYLNCASSVTLSNAVNQARELGITAPIYSYLYPAERSFLTATGRNSDGIIFLAIPDLSNAQDRFRLFVASYSKQFGQSPNYDFLVASTYNAVLALTDGGVKAGLRGSALKDFLRSYQEVGSFGPVEFDDNGDIKNLNFVLKRIRDGEVGKFLG